ncbi:hypothetical protein EDD86DRAFT_201244 [Gorgonomyces haynaldii]|nr:hypothetical protein EDD86DRAFT_201244 [Gorgonomyces haynaldii]
MVPISCELLGENPKTESKVRVHTLTQEREYRTKQFGSKTIFDLFERSAMEHAGKPFLGHRQFLNRRPDRYVWMSYKQASDKVLQLATGLVKIGLEPGTKLALFANNCPSLFLVEMAAFRQSAVSVPLHPILEHDEPTLEHNLNISGAQMILTHFSFVPMLLRLCARLPQLKTIITLEPVDNEICSWALLHGMVLLSLNQVEDLYDGTPTKAHPPKPDAISHIPFSEGINAIPAGVIVTHAMITSVVDALLLLEEHQQGYTFHSSDVHLSYVSNANMFEIVLGTAMMAAGAKIGCWSGQQDLLMDDLKTLQPTVLASSPRIFKKIYEQVNDQIQKASMVEKSIFRAAMIDNKLQISKMPFIGGLMQSAVFGRVRRVLGGKIRLLFNGVKSLDTDVGDFLRTVFGCPLVETYGQMETCFAVSMTPTPKHMVRGTVGVPLPSCHVKLVDVPELGYLTTNSLGAGEICIKAPYLFKGYYKDSARTQLVIDKDGFFHTGDIGKFEQGHLVFLSSFRHYIRLRNTFFVDPIKIEAAYSKHTLISNIMVYGDSTKNYLAAIVVITPPVLFEFLKQHDILPDDQPLDLVVQDTKIRKLIAAKLNHWVQENNLLQDNELFKEMILDTTPFADNGLLSATFKTKRHQVLRHYATQMERVWMHGAGSIRS